ncbi:hematopoietic progenitor cell antigen CD34 [Malurus melanocephalus]|uniref:hematopoietic progenitor cell antigen CD34 n=1 Tax=Malurus melanocephalus TaxID=175006 RepID=UPI0025487FE9|nr:hematopoietic progenitor cell antigen CD34 [Malurus melanocephalus]
MLFLGFCTAMKWKQLLCVVVSVVELAGCAAGSPTETPTPTATGGDTTSGTASGETDVTTASRDISSATATSAAAGSVATSPSSPGPGGQLRTTPQPNPAPTSPPGSSPQPQPRSPGAQRSHQNSNGNAQTSTSVAEAENCSVWSVKCLFFLKILQEHFLARKGSDLWRAICENRTHSVESPCEIKLTPSSLDRNCLLLILKGEKDPDKLLHTLQSSPLEKFGIESLKKESAGSRRESSQKTLIALVTSGLLLAFLGLAGYFLMKRRSWSPAGQRLAEDPYYTESQGNAMLMTPSQEPPELQEKPNLPNLNGGTQENGTGQASSKNGHSKNSPADSEM